MTPEGRVKARISKILKAYEPELWKYMPVPGGFGKQALDYIGCYRGQFFSIEAKAPGNKPTLKQEGTIADIQIARGRVFIIDGDTQELEQWLNAVATLR